MFSYQLYQSIDLSVMSVSSDMHCIEVIRISSGCSSAYDSISPLWVEHTFSVASDQKSVSPVSGSYGMKRSYLTVQSPFAPQGTSMSEPSKSRALDTT